MTEETHDEIVTEKRNGNEANDPDQEKENATKETNHVISVIKSVKNGSQSMEKSKLKKNPSMMVRSLNLLFPFFRPIANSIKAIESKLCWLFC